jgi:hypothetical protein
MSGEERGLGAQLQAMVPPEPRAGLADDVLARVARRGRASPGWGRAAAAGAAVGALATIAVLALWPSPAAHGGGAWRAAARATVPIGARAVAVVEPYTELAWRVAGDATRVEQRTGTAFYRVDDGGPFRVITPAATITVAGTCFTVEVTDMKRPHRNTIGGAAAGAFVATLVTVTVYEGRVLFADGHGEVAVAAGQQARTLGDRPPVVSDAGSTVATAASGATTARTGDPAAAREVVALRSTVAQLEQRLAQANTMIGELRHEANIAPRVAPSREQLLAWARNCEIHIDTPDVFATTPARLDDDSIRRWGIAPAELAPLHEALAEAHADAYAELRRLYIESTGDATGADQLSPSAMHQEILDKAAPGTLDAARARMARERAGLAEPPPNLRALPPAEQVLRLFARLGNDFEQLVAERLGADRARSLRERWNGWPGMRFDTSGCPK